jgi:plasmid stability protein
MQIKGVPAEVHATLRRRAAAAGQSLQEYLLEWLTEEAQATTTPTVTGRGRGSAGRDSWRHTT